MSPVSTMPQMVDLLSDGLPATFSRPISPSLLSDMVLGCDNTVQAAIDAQSFTAFELAQDRDEKILFCYFAAAQRPCFSESVLGEAQSIQRMARSFFGDGAEVDPPLRYLVFGSHVPGVWNLVADLELIATLIRKRERAALRRYAHACCDIGFVNATGLGFDLPVVSVALVQGDAIGTGFETALSANLIVAERSAKFGLPEILYNLFPGMGAYTFLTRRVAPGIAERIITSGEMYSAEQLHAMGAIDVLAPDGRGLEALYDFIGRGGRRYASLRALYRARRIAQSIAFEEMTRIADLWVEAALALDEGGLNRMLRLVPAQTRPRR